MKQYILFNLSDGMIIRCGICSDSDLSYQEQDGCGLIEHERVDDSRFKVDVTTLEIVPVD